MLVTLCSQRVKCISIRAVSYDRSNVLNAWWKRKNQTNRQTTFTWSGQFLKKPDDSPKQYLMFEMNTMVWNWNVQYNESEWWMIPLFNLLDLFRSYFSVLLGTTASTSVETTSKKKMKCYNIQILLEAEWSNGKCAEPWMKQMALFSFLLPCYCSSSSPHSKYFPYPVFPLHQ